MHKYVETKDFKNDLKRMHGAFDCKRRPKILFLIIQV